MIADNRPKIACCWNAEMRNNGTGRRVWDTLVRMGLKDHGLIRHNRPPYSEVNWKDYDMMLFVDDDCVDIPMPSVDIPSACWLVDTHLGYDTRLEWAKCFDKVFVAQKPSVEKMSNDGLSGKVEWLPLACHPPVDPTPKELVDLKAVNSLNDLKRIWDLCFVGFLNDDQEGNSRIEYLDRIFSAFPNSWLATGRFFTEAAVRYAKARVGFNISIRDDLNMRFFEALSYESCLVTNTDVVGWQDLGFRDREHFVGYIGMEDAIEKIQWCLDNPIERVQIARNGREFVRSYHTYTHRVEQIIQSMTEIL